MKSEKQINSNSEKIVLVTGCAGYAGSILIRKLLKEEFKVVGIDNLRFGGSSLVDIWEHRNFEFKKIDINNGHEIDKAIDAYKFFAVIHLAAIVGDPACNLEPELAEKTNKDASVHLLEQTMKLNIPRFVFASTCSNYGKMEDSNGYVDENSPLTPVSLYARLKVEFEDLILNRIEKKENFCPTALRFSTVYGISPRMRFDLTINEFVKELALRRELIVFGEQFWRPYCHVKDFSRAILTVLNSHKDEIAYNVFNVGGSNQNYTKRMIVDELLRQIPEGRVKYVQKEEDPRDYRVKFDKIKNELGFRISKTVPDGIRDILSLIRLGIIEDPDNQRFYNILHESKSK